MVFLKSVHAINLRMGARLDRTVAWVDARGHWFAALCLVAMTMALYHRALSGWWTYDDPIHLKEAILYSPAEYFFVPHIWQGYQGGFFTPLLTLSYDFDFSLFGVDPTPFYVHQLVSVALAVFAFYSLLTLWVSRSVALLGAMLLLISPPLALASSWLAIRHYVEGLALASFALYAWVMALRGKSAAGCWGSAALYMFAMLAKEIYVPLAAMMLLLPERTWRERLRFSWPLWTSLAFYLAWRFWMLGGQIGGYGHFSTNWEGAPDAVTEAVLLLPFMYLIKLFGVNWALPVWLGIFGAMIVAWASRAPAKRLGFVVVMIMLVSLPLVPVVSDLRPDGVFQEQRFVMVPAAAFILSLSLWLSRFGAGDKARVFQWLILAGVGAGLWVHSRVLLEDWKEPEIQKQEGKFLLERRSETDILAVSASNTNYFYRGMDWLRDYLGRGLAPTAVYGGYFGLEPDNQVRKLAQRIYRFESSCGCFRDATNAVMEERQNIESRIVALPLYGELSWGQGTLTWDLGPYEKGRYFLLAGQRPDWYSSGREVRRHGTIAYMLEGYMRVGYESPENWITFSPEFHVNLAVHGRFDWGNRRPGSRHAAPVVEGM